MPRFVAIPVSQGDAFYLKTTAGSALIDGGRSVSGFPGLFQSTTRSAGVDILVATHNDADHANGVLGFLEAGLRCNEVWLPGAWAHLLPQVLQPWEEIVQILAPQVEAVDMHLPDGVSLLEQYAECMMRPEHMYENNNQTLELDESGWPGALIDQLEQASEEDSFWALPWRKYYFYYACFPAYTPKRRLLLESILAAKRIRQIALTAYHRGIPVRWFEYDRTNPSGGCSWLKPVNSRQIARVIRAQPPQFLNLLALTVWNKESLVFWASPPYAGAGVLFTADSDLKGVQIPILDGAIVTAPHHGSEANKGVYSLISAPVIWIRSDGRFKNRPCPEYLQAQGKRFCTLCRNSPDPKQAVTLWHRSDMWVPGRGERV
uniref:hypothetical protein n=1 Tax=Thermogutta sp. TaxID=1962930 RepID=UPI00321FAA9E